MNKKESPFTYKTPNEATGFLLWKTHNHWQREIKKSLKEFDLTHTQFVVLANTFWLSLSNETLTQINIAKQAETDVMMTSNVIRTLEKKGFLNRTEHKTDTRAKAISLTTLGEEVLKKAVKKVEDFDRKFFSNLEDSSKFNEELISLMG